MECLRRIGTSLVAVALTLCALAGSAQAHSAAPVETSAETGCVIHSLGSFTDQGEEATVASVADVIEVECEPAYGGSTVLLEAQELYERCDGNLAWSEPYESTPARNTPTYPVTLDGDGGAIAVLWAGPHCTPGQSLIAADLEAAPYTTFTTSFTVKAPAVTPPGATALPATQVENADNSSVATIIEVEFPPVDAEKRVTVTTGALFARCAVPPHLVWTGPDGQVLASSTGALEGLQLDDDGNAFVVLLGGGSCAPGTSLVEVSLESKPYTTYTTTFTIEPPQATWEEPGFTIEKLQRLSNGAGGFVETPLTGAIGQTVEYEMLVKNTGNVPLSFPAFDDPHCDAATLAGPPASALFAPGETAIFTCDHVLDAVGPYTNVAAVTAETPEGRKLPESSNQVLVTVPEEPSFTIVKEQELSGSVTGFTTAALEGLVGETVDYQIVIENTGNVPLSFPRGLVDERCDPGSVAGGPGSNQLAPGGRTVFTCSHVLAEAGSYVNVASVTGVTPHGPETRHESSPVEVKVTPPSAGLAFRIEKAQKIEGSTGGFTAALLTGAVGETVDYEIVVRNVGGVPAFFSDFEDENCAPGTLAGGPQGMPVAPGAQTVYTCSRPITAAGALITVASVKGTAGSETVEHTSNLVEVAVPTTPSPVTPRSGNTPFTPSAPLPKGGVLASCEALNPTAVLRGATGPKRRPFTVSVSSAGVEQITFYLDGRAIKRLNPSSARHGRFSLSINPRKLSYGSHRLAIKEILADSLCPPAAGRSVFVRPRSQRVKPKFTG